MYKLKIITRFAAAHKLRGYEGKCENLHGHNWKVEVSILSNKLNKIGLVLDFKEIKRTANEVIQELDHSCLNEMQFFSNINPSSENIAKYIYDRLSGELKKKGVTLAEVTVWESEDASASYEEEVKG